jgi:DNA recombination protein RmuC
LSRLGGIQKREPYALTTANAFEKNERFTQKITAQVPLEQSSVCDERGGSSMTETLTWLIVLLLVTNAVLLVIQLLRLPGRAWNASEKAIREEFRVGREESSKAARELREEVAASLKSTADTIVRTIGEMGTQQKSQLEAVTTQLKELMDMNQSRIEKLRETVDAHLGQLQESNEKRLDEMRKTVDEKLHGTLEKRLGESFKIVSERLEAVQRGLGEMQNLATGVGDLKRVLTNVKARGTWAEIQLGAILEQILTPDQYDKNVQTKEESREIVEYAIRLPGPNNEPDTCVWMPIDSKFPQEDYIRLLDAADSADADAVQKSTAALVRAVRGSAKDIRDKYLNPPKTTDFALMFLPTEGLYAEVLRQPGLIENLQQNYRVVVTGPTTLTAILSSLRMGFRTLAIERRASEVWKVLAAVKTEFGKFGGVLDKVKKQLSTASRTIEETGVRTRAMERRLREVEQLPSDAAADVLNLPDIEPAGSADEEREE